MHKGYFSIKAILFLILISISGCSSLSHEEQITSDQTANFPVYVVNHGGHTGVVLVGELSRQHLPFLYEDFNHSKYIEVGWGDEEYYQSKEKTTNLRLKAVLLPTSAVLRVTEVPIDPDKYYSELEVRKLMVTQYGLRKMMAYISKTFKRDGNGNPIKTGEGMNAYDLFYHANGKFHMLNTCNAWTAKVLKKAGLPITSFLTITSDDIMSQIRDYLTSASGSRINKSGL